jgi:chorismate mutase/prephenate dehydratase
MTDLAELRARIDALDEQVLALANERAELAQHIGKLKAGSHARFYVPERERQVMQRLLEQNRGPLSADAVQLIFKEIISACLALESPLLVAYLGPEATFTHAATKRHFGLSARLLPRRTIAEVFADVERGRATYGVIPIENSTEGIVNHTLDSFMHSDLCIIAEVLLQVSHHLLNRSGDLGGITKVYSHPQALAQCRNWLHANLPGVALVDVSSTARAAELAAEDGTAAAVASDLAASLYNLQIASSHLEDLSGNLTRFLVIGDEASAPSGQDRTSLMFAVRDQPGVLFEALQHFATRHINMSRIESRPSRRRAWDYLFFIDLDGHRDDLTLTEALAALQGTCEFVKVLGSYPRGALR